ncbi:aldo/keto reductase [Runella aurantiaca]|uniref:Aldo/keto reductase n=1 Tax=Runella aurantiaca TaxID=2282308 RepID=A0A369ICX5_9BACT|nr:aldo/keto reductase [Runella aurantiaca]RDB07619.1 aldo/keto reductase [Runella aurantiaca]
MIPLITLNNGITMPQLGLGIYDPQPDQDIKQAVLWAFELGYRLVDTAAAYKNEREVGQAIGQSGLAREEIFVTTKVRNEDQGYAATLRAFEESLRQLNTDYVDLYLIHWPVKEHRIQTWKALEQIYAEGKARAIGVSNYYIPHFEELWPDAEIIPAVNQFELSPYCYLPEQMQYCSQRGIQVEGYAPLVRGLKANDARLVQIAEKYGKSTFQVLIRWSLQQGAITIPKSVSKNRLAANIDVFDFQLSAEDMAEMNTWHDNTRVADDPMDY